MDRRLVTALCLALPLVFGGAAQAYPGADAGPAPWTPPRGRPAPTRTLALVPPTEVLQPLLQAGIPTSSLGFYARQVNARRPFAALNEEQPFVLASTAKLVTSLAALDLLGTDYRWTTRAYARGEIIDGRLEGDLLIVGGGDGTLGSQALRRWFTQLHEQGLREITGNIVIDRLAFALSPQDLARTPKPDPVRPHHVWPDAFTLDEGVLSVEVQALPKGRAAVRMQPTLADVQVVSAVAHGSDCAAHAQLVPPAAGEGPLQLKVVATMTPECGVRRIGLVPLSHAEFTARAIAALWTETGGTLHGRVVERSPSDAIAAPAGEGEAGEPQPLSVLESEPLPVVVRDMNKASNNVLARNLLLSLSPGFPTQPARLDAARDRVQAWLRRQGLRVDDIVIDSGSGLSRLETGKARAMVHLLAQAWQASGARYFVDSLPVAGVDGTLANRLQAGPATGRAWLKTGTLLDTRALAGYVKGRSGKVYAVAVIVNHPDAARATPALDALIEWIAAEG